MLQIEDMINDEEVLLNFLAFLDLIGKGNQVSFALSALHANFSRLKMKSFTKSPLVTQVVKGIGRIAAKKKIDKEERLPLPASAIINYIRNKPVGMKVFTWKRNCALLVLGFRCMRRPGELGKIKKSDVTYHDGMFLIQIRQSKTDQMRRRKTIPIEASNNLVSCPVRILQSYLKDFDSSFSRDDFLFPSLNEKSRKSKGISGPVVNKIVKDCAVWAKCEGRFSGHSLRIGGATAALSGGLSMAMIRAIGEWESDAVLRYLRAQASAAAKASQRMGL